MGALKKLVVIGHSHAGCLASAEAEDWKFEVVGFWTTPDAIEIDKDRKTLSRSIASRLTSPTISMCGGGAHTVLSLARHPRPFDFILPEAPDLPLDPEAEILPYAVVRRRLEVDVKEYLDLTAEVQSRAPGPVWHVDAPPPAGDAEFMRPHIPWPLFPGRAHEVSPRWHRYRMWRLNTDIARAWCRKAGVGFIGHAQSAEDEEGFLRASHCSDGIHGNEAYGRLLAEKIIAVVDQGRFGPHDFPPSPANSGGAS